MEGELIDVAKVSSCSNGNPGHQSNPFLPSADSKPPDIIESQLSEAAYVMNGNA
jgi:hypothetical protein